MFVSLLAKGYSNLTRRVRRSKGCSAFEYTNVISPTLSDMLSRERCSLKLEIRRRSDDVARLRGLLASQWKILMHSPSKFSKSLLPESPPATIYGPEAALAIYPRFRWLHAGE